MSWLVLAGLLAASSAALAAPRAVQEAPQAAAGGQCSAPTVAALARHLEAAPGHASPVAQACKAWPFDPSITLAAIAWTGSPAQVAAGERQLALVVAMLSPRGEVLAAHRSQLSEDAALELSEGALRLDTARYDLAPGRRAFGVVVSSSARGASCPERGYADELTLYLRQGSSLQPVLSTYLQAWDFVEGSPCQRDVPLVTDTAAITLQVQRSRSHGLADIRLRAAITRERNDWTGAPGSAQRRSAERLLHFDGTTYQADAYTDLFFWTEDDRRD